MENFIKKKQAYLKRLTKYVDIVIRFLCNNETVREAAVLMEPRTDLELDFAISTLDYVDDMEKLIENIVNGHIEKINLDESLFVNYMVELLKMTDDFVDVEYIEEKMEKVREELVSDDLEFLANLKYEFTVFSLTNSKAVLDTIMKKSGVDINDKYTVLKLNFIYDMLQEGMAKGDSEKDYEKMIKFNKKFHERCEKGIDKYTSNTVDRLMDEIFGDDDLSRVYKK